MSINLLVQSQKGKNNANEKQIPVVLNKTLAGSLEEETIK